MRSSEYLHRSGFFEYNALVCLRNEYAYNTCSTCMDVCPEKAFELIRGKLHLLVQECTSCGVCIGGCPSGALSFYEGFDLRALMRSFAKEDKPVLTCKRNVPCLAVLSVESMMAMGLQAQETILCDLSQCASCELNDENTLLPLIESRLDEAHDVAQRLDAKGFSKEYGIHETTRRDFFKRLTKTFVSKEMEEEVDITVYRHWVPAARQELKYALRGILEHQEAKQERSWSMLHMQHIDERCTNCGDCVQFCPTGALSYTQDKTTLLFQGGRCIGCHICHDVCKENAMSTKGNLTLVDFALDRAKVLIRHQLATCSLCRCAFSQKDQELICSRCAGFEKEHGAMFTLASELK